MSHIARILDAVAHLPAVTHQTCLLAPDVSRLEQWARGCRGPVLEIGTRHGLTAALFALCGHEVVTVDITSSEHRRAVWEAVGVADRITSVSTGVVPARPDLKYPTAFVDAHHTYKGCREHWHAIKHHVADDALLLFDDMNYGGGEGGRYWREMGAEDYGRFGRLQL